jgi:hypothetical protein
MAKSFIKQSKIEWQSSGPDVYPGHERIQLGCLQRIADATEAMAKPFVNLVSERERYERYYKSEREDNKRLARRIAALQGVITKMKNSKSK